MLLTLFTLFVVVPCVYSQGPSTDKISSLPGWDQPLASNHYSGYIDVSPKTGRFLHYWFVESEGNPSKDPIVLWLNGGPGCSSLDGFFYEQGPIHFAQESPVKLVRNPYAWTKIANVLFLEAPAGVGFSYSNNPNDYITDDNRTADDNYQFLKNWFALYPQYVNNDFWITGESYAGVYVPTLALRVLMGNLKGEFKPILKGVMSGNAVTNSPLVNQLNGYVSFLFGHGLISVSQFQAVNASCTADPNSNDCQQLLQNAYANTNDIDMYDIYGDCFHQRPVDSELKAKLSRMGIKITQNSKRNKVGDIPCIDSDFAQTYLNDPAVKKAIHVKADINWVICNDYINQNYDRTPDSMVPIYKQLIKNGRKVLVYSGDTDFSVPYTDSQYWTQFDMGLPLKQEWAQWYFQDDEGQQVAGFKNVYAGGFTFATVRGSGHMVPQFRPAPAYAMFQRFLNDQPL